MIKYDRISVEDNITFKYNSDAMNDCFGDNYTMYFREARKDSHDGCTAWFPKEAIISNGTYKPGSTEVNWKNILSEDGTKIKMFLYPGESMKKDKEEYPTKPQASPMHCFLYSSKYNNEYKYVGTFICDLAVSTEETQILRRVSDHIDLGNDYSYIDFSKSGNPILSDYYLKHDFPRHEGIIREFENRYDHTDENSLIAECKEFWNKYSLNTLNTMDVHLFEEEFIEELCILLSSIRGSNTRYTDFYSGDKNIFLSEVFNLFSSELPVPDLLRKCGIRSDIAGAILFTHKQDCYIYSLNEEITDQYISKLRLYVSGDDDLIEKQSKLLFWKQVNYLLDEWSIYKYCAFLSDTFPVIKEQIKYVPSPKPTITKRFDAEERAIEEELAESNLPETPKSFEYLCSPRPREINTNEKKANGQLIVRHDDRRINALVKANFACEIDENHPTFIRKNSDQNYTETHHLIPIKYSGQFENTLDTEENIVSLCSNCHNQIHYGKGAEKLLKKLYDERAELLEKAGISKTIDGIDITYEQLLHMYGL